MAVRHREHQRAIGMPSSTVAIQRSQLRGDEPSQPFFVALGTATGCFWGAERTTDLRQRPSAHSRITHCGPRDDSWHFTSIPKTERSRGSAFSETNALAPKRAEGARIFRSTLGHQRGRGFADRVFADWRFADGPLTNWRGLDNRLRAREVRSGRRSHQSQRRNASDCEFQHEAPCCS
jgi:hypothetical protein